MNGVKVPFSEPKTTRHAAFRAVKGKEGSQPAACGRISYPQLAQMTPFEHIMIESLTSFFEAIPPSIKTDWDVGLPFTLSCTLHTARERLREGGVDDDRSRAAGPPFFLGRPRRQNLNKAL